MSKKILSWDVGIKNLAYCVIEKNDNDFKILNWGVINLVDDRQKCQFQIRGGNTCSTDAKFLIYHRDKAPLFEGYENGNIFVCTKHKSKMIPEVNEIVVKKQKGKKKVECDERECCYDDCCSKPMYELTKTSYCWCEKHYEKKGKSFIKKINAKKVTVSKATRQPMFDLSGKLFNRLDKDIKNFIDVSEVLIENQPSLKNPAMKTMASILYSYFIIRGIIDKDKTKSTIEDVRFVSPSNKLKVNEKNTNRVLNDEKDKKKANEMAQVYKLTKSLGVKYCKALIDENDNKILEKIKKKDDMCDAFLQGFQYLFNPVPDKYFKKLEKIGFADTKKKSKITKKPTDESEDSDDSEDSSKNSKVKPKSKSDKEAANKAKSKPDKDTTKNNTRPSKEVIKNTSSSEQKINDTNSTDSIVEVKNIVKRKK